MKFKHDMTVLFFRRRIIISCGFMLCVFLMGLYTQSIAQKWPIIESGIPLESIARKNIQYNDTLMISVESVIQKQKKGEKVVLIDVRRKDDFKKFQIPDSINIPLHFIKTKLFLKSTPIVLINEGYSITPLEQECKKLNALGYNALILQGGIYYWERSGHPVQGDWFAIKKLSRIAPKYFFQEKNYLNWLVIDISNTKNQDALELIPDMVHIPVSKDMDYFVMKLKKAITKHQKKTFPYILITNGTGEQYKNIEKVLTQKGMNVFYLEGGFQAYWKFLYNFALSLSPKSKRLKTVKNCNDCGQDG